MRLGRHERGSDGSAGRGQGRTAQRGLHDGRHLWSAHEQYTPRLGDLGRSVRRRLGRSECAQARGRGRRCDGAACPPNRDSSARGRATISRDGSVSARGRAEISIGRGAPTARRAAISRCVLTLACAGRAPSRSHLSNGLDCHAAIGRALPSPREPSPRSPPELAPAIENASGSRGNLPPRGDFARRCARGRRAHGRPHRSQPCQGRRWPRAVCRRRGECYGPLPWRRRRQWCQQRRRDGTLWALGRVHRRRHGARRPRTQAARGGDSWRIARAAALPAEGPPES